MEIFPIKNRIHSLHSIYVSSTHPLPKNYIQSVRFRLSLIEITTDTDERRIIKHIKKITLYNNNMPWRKIRSDIDVTMGSFDGAETCELVGLFLLSQLTHLDVNVGLYRDEGLATCTSPKQVEAIKKEMCKIFKHKSLQITIAANKKKVVDFLDITLDLRPAIYKPYMKPNSNLTYIHKQSNHPPSIIKNLPKSINKRLSTNLKMLRYSMEHPPHTEALKKNDCNTNLQFDKTCTNKNNEKKKRESGKLHGSTHPLTLMWPQMLRKHPLH